MRLSRGDVQITDPQLKYNVPNRYIGLLTLQNPQSGAYPRNDPIGRRQALYISTKRFGVVDKYANFLIGLCRAASNYARSEVGNYFAEWAGYR